MPTAIRIEWVALPTDRRQEVIVQHAENERVIGAQLIPEDDDNTGHLNVYISYSV